MEDKNAFFGITTVDEMKTLKYVLVYEFIFRTFYTSLLSVSHYSLLQHFTLIRLLEAVIVIQIIEIYVGQLELFVSQCKPEKRTWFAVNL